MKCNTGLKKVKEKFLKDFQSALTPKVVTQSSFPRKTILKYIANFSGEYLSQRPSLVKMRTIGL